MTGGLAGTLNQKAVCSFPLALEDILGLTGDCHGLNRKCAPGSCVEGLVPMQQCAEAGPSGSDWVRKALSWSMGQTIDDL
jgi:hypothetical protein